MADFRWCVWEWIRFTAIALCGGREDPRGMCKQPSNYPKVLPSTASGWGMWMQEGFIWRAFFQRSEILLVLARNALIRVFTQESVLLSLNHMHLWGKSQVMEMLILLVEISFERQYLVSQKYSTNSITSEKWNVLTGEKKNKAVTQESCNNWVWPFHLYLLLPLFREKKKKRRFESLLCGSSTLCSNFLELSEK